MEYRCEATSPVGFVQQLVSCYLPHGYWFYVPGCIPEHKDPRSVDEKLLAKYGIGVSRSSRARRKQAGIANVHYLRHERFFALLATHGHHPFYDDEADNIRDVRRVPIKFAGYSISVKKGGYRRKASPNSPAIRDDKWRVRVQIDQEIYRDLTAYFLDIALLRTVEQLSRDLFSLLDEPYAPVRPTWCPDSRRVPLCNPGLTRRRPDRQFHSMDTHRQSSPRHRHQAAQLGVCPPRRPTARFPCPGREPLPLLSVLRQFRRRRGNGLHSIHRIEQRQPLPAKLAKLWIHPAGNRIADRITRFASEVLLASRKTARNP